MEWAEIRRLGDSYIVESADKALAHLHLSQAFLMTGSTAQDHKQAVHHSAQAIEVSESTTLQLWAIGRHAGLLADAGRFTEAESFARTYFASLPANDAAKSSAPWAWYALARCHSRTRRHAEALLALRNALHSATPELAERIQITTARVLARGGKVMDAWQALPNEVRHVSIGKLHAAKSLLYSAQGNWSEAEREAKQALKHRDAFAIVDVVELAELLLTLKRSAVALGRFTESAVWSYLADSLLDGWSAELKAVLLAITPPKGGEFRSEATRCGAAGHHRRGSLGVVG